MAREKVLIIEDEKPWQRQLRRILEEADYQVTVVDTYPAAMDALRRETAKLAVVDLSLIPRDPYDRQGLEIMKRATIPVVCISGYLKPDEKEKIKRLRLASWVFDKKDASDDPDEFEKRFLRQVVFAIALSEFEVRARWREIWKEIVPPREGD